MSLQVSHSIADVLVDLCRKLLLDVCSAFMKLAGGLFLALSVLLHEFMQNNE